MGIFEVGPWAFGDKGHRHSGVLVKGDKLYEMWARIGDAPERILHSTVNLSNYLRDDCGTKGKEILRFEFDWESAHLPTTTSNIGGLTKQEHALRDPLLFEESQEIRYM